jgi:hypothetical protein
MREQEVRHTHLVISWHDAVNARDCARLRALVSENVELVGRRGSAFGADALCAWAEQSGIALAPTEIIERGDVLVAAEEARWRDASTGEVGDVLPVATIFEVAEGRICRVARVDTLQAALALAFDGEGAEQ